MNTTLRLASRLAVLALLAASLASLAACGNKGDLVHPAPADKPAST
jgi:predicted small lipoprotein YifL